MQGIRFYVMLWKPSTGTMDLEIKLWWSWWEYGLNKHKNYHTWYNIGSTKVLEEIRLL